MDWESYYTTRPTRHWVFGPPPATRRLTSLESVSRPSNTHESTPSSPLMSAELDVHHECAVDGQPRLSTYDLESYAQRYWDLKGHERTCLNCGRLRREDSTRPSDRFFEDSYRSSLKDIYAGEQPRDRRYTDHDGVVGVHCDECGTTDSHTLVYEGETLSTGEVCDRLEDVAVGLEELFDEDVDIDEAIDYVLATKRNPETTNWPTDEILERAVAIGLVASETRGLDEDDAVFDTSDYEFINEADLS